MSDIPKYKIAIRAINRIENALIGKSNNLRHMLSEIYTENLWLGRAVVNSIDVGINKFVRPVMSRIIDDERGVCH